MKNNYAHKAVNKTESNFRELLNEEFFKPFRKTFLHDFKNMCEKSKIKNLFELRQVRPDAPVVVRWAKLRNPLTEDSHYFARGIKSHYYNHVSAVAIKLDCSNFMFQANNVVEGELLIAINKDYSPNHIELHVKRENLPKTVMVLKPDQVYKAIGTLMG